MAPYPIELPQGYQLLRWKALDGSSVRKGEVLAQAVTADSPLPIATAPPKPKHKRPTRRKRPAPAKKPADDADMGNTAAVAEAKAATSSTVGTLGKLLNSVSSTATSAPLVSDPDPKKNVPTATGNAPTTSEPNKAKEMLISAPADGIVRYDPSSGESATVIGFIDDCSHPTIVGRMCAVCGMTVQQDSDGNTKDSGAHSSSENAMSRMTVAGLTVSVSNLEGQRIAEHEADRLHRQRKLSLVLDLDLTLLHATDDHRAIQHQHHCSVRNFFLRIIIPNQPARYSRHFVKLRPHVGEFLMEAMERFEVGVYTAGTRDYAEQIVLVLARDIVGAPMDHVEIDQLRFKIKQVEAELSIKKKEADEIEKTRADEIEAGEVEKTKTEEDAQNKTEEPSQGDEATATSKPESEVVAPGQGKKRKRVTFQVDDERPNDVVSEAGLLELRSKLEEAERLERKAVELRQKLFGSRVVSRTDVEDLGRDVKSLKRVFPCGGTMAVVVDDREDVWANAEEIFSTRRGEPPDNLLWVEPYRWKSFQGFAEVNKTGVDLSKPIEDTDSEKDEQLRWTGKILKELHERYYSRLDKSDRVIVPEILAGMRSEVLQGCQIVLSGLVPLERQTQNAMDPRPSSIRYVQSLGGSLLTQVDGSVTHVVAAKDGTDKILCARKIRGCRVVTLSWLLHCFWTFSRAKEENHLLALGRLPPPRDPPTRPVEGSREAAKPLIGSTRENSSSSSCSSDDGEEDDFINDLASELMEEPSRS